MNRSTTHYSLRSYAIAFILLAMLMGLFVSLGQWQIRRANEREHLAQLIEAGRQKDRVSIDSLQSLEKTHPWQRIRISGRWRDELTVLLDNRNDKGRPGYWVATPLELHTADLQGQAILVLRGWLARIPGQTPRVPPAPVGQNTIEADVLTRVPRLFELPGSQQARHGLPERFQGKSSAIPVVQNLYVSELAQVSELTLLKPVLVQATPESGLHSINAEPNVDFHKNRGYALQWFVFALIALLFSAGLVRQAYRHRLRYFCKEKHRGPI